MRAWTTVAVLTLVCVAPACSSGNGGSARDDATVSVASSGAGTDATTAPESSAAPTVETATVETATVETTAVGTAPPTTVPPITSPLAATGVGGLEVVSPTSDVGERPTFAWASVTTAVEYSLVVSDADTGAPIWAWRGTETEVALGAGLIGGQEGPRLTGAATFDVFALAASGAVVAASGPVPLSP